MDRIIEPELLRSFLAITETGSFSEAAVQVGRTQSAVSMQMKRLEEVLGRPVFERNGRTVKLSRDGEVLVGHARRILRAHQEALSAFMESELAGGVVLGTPDQYAATFVPPILARFAETHPRIHVEVRCDVSDVLLRQVNTNALDLTLLTYGHHIHEGTLLWREPMVWVTSAQHCAHEQTPLPLAVFQGGCWYREALVNTLGQIGRPYRIAYSSLSLAGIEAALRSGLAVSVLPASNVAPGFRVLGPDQDYPELPPNQISLKRASGSRSPVVDALERHILETCQSELPFVEMLRGCQMAARAA
ncbi:MAG: LysR family transcriptional regulator [Rhodospirillaceae bacterium]|nr:LysR family transcriptional regulator [Rhodospirillaceae bacterium]